MKSHIYLVIIFLTMLIFDLNAYDLIGQPDSSSDDILISEMNCQPANIPYKEDFESGFDSCWNRDDASTSFISSDCRENLGSFLQLNGGVHTTITPTIDVSSESSIDVSWDIFTGCNDAAESGEDLIIDYWDGTAWQNMITYDPANLGDTWSPETFTITSGLTPDFKVRFVRPSGTGSGPNADDISIDNFEVIATPDCSTAVLPYQEDFESGELNACWDASNSFQSNISSNCGTNAGSFLRMRGGVHQIETREIDVSNTCANSVDVRFELFNGCGEPAEVGENLEVHYWNGSSWQLIVNYDPVELPTGWSEHSHTITNGLTSSFKLKFERPSGTGSGFKVDDISIDDLQVIETPETIPYVEDFESGIDSCWERDDVSTSFITSNCGENTGSFLQLNGGFHSTTTENIDVSSVSSIDVSWEIFNGCNEPADAGENLEVDYWNGTSWENIITYDPNTDLEEIWRYKRYTITSGLTSGFKLRFTRPDNTGSGVNADDIDIDNIQVYATPDCNFPAGIDTTQIDPDSATLSWNTIGNANSPINYEWLLMPDGLSPTNDQALTAYGQALDSGQLTDLTEVQIQGLVQNTDYEFFVRQDCGNSNYSDWSPAYSFITACSFETLPYLEDFEGGFSNCWSRTADDQGFIANGCADNNGNYLLLKGGVHTVETSIIDVSGETNIDVSWDIYNGCDETADPGENLVVDYWNGSSWQNIVTYDPANLTSNWTSDSFSINSGLTSDFKVRFVRPSGTTSGSNADDIDIDNFEVKVTPGCDAVALPYTEDFENGFDNCWVRDDVSTSFINSNCGDNTGNFLQLNGGFHSTITKNIDVSGETNIDVSWDIVNGCNEPADPGENLEVDYWNGTSWQNIVTYDPTTDLEKHWLTKRYELSSGLTSDFKLRFTRPDNTGSGVNADDISLDNVQVVPTPNCNFPINVNTFAVTSTTVDFKWDAVVSASEGFEYILMPDGDQPDPATSVSSGFNASTLPSGPLTQAKFTQLNPNTNYDIYVRSKCGANEFSEWSDVESFGTGCAVTAIPYIEDFESGFDSCWSRTDAGQSYIASNCGGVNGDYLQMKGGFHTTETKTFDISNADAIDISFSIYNGCDEPADPGENLIVEYWNDTEWQNLDTFDPVDLTTNWEEKTYTVDASDADNLKLRFIRPDYTGSGVNADDINIDDLAITETLFYVENGTCKCPDANFGDSGQVTINGQQQTYTKRTRAQLDALIAADINDPQIALTCTSGITDMSNLFEGTDIDQNINAWDVSNVTTMNSMFKDVSISFNQPLGNWDTSNVTDMSYMFHFAYAFDQNINSWDVSNVTNMNSMFYRTAAFDQPLDSWEVSNVTNMENMFQQSAFNQSINNWDVSSVTSMAYMFAIAQSYDQALSDWDVSNLTNADFMFANASSFDQDISDWCVAQINNEPTNFSVNSPLSVNNKPNWGNACNIITWNGSSWVNGTPNENNAVIIDGDYNGGNLAKVKELTVNSGKTLNIYDKLQVEDNIENNGQIIFKNDATVLGQFDEFTGNMTGSGEVTVERYIPVLTEGTRAFRFLTSAVNSSGSIYDDWQEGGNTPTGFGTHITGDNNGNNGVDQTITGNPSMYTFDNTLTGDQSNAWEPVLDTKANSLQAGTAYRMFIRGDRNYDLSSNPADAPNSNVTLRATGDLATGDQTFNLSNEAGYYSLIGNPYQSIVSMNAVTSTNTNTNFYWVWDPNMSARGAYVSVQLPGGTPNMTSSANQYIQPGQSFFVQTLNNGAADMTFTESAKDLDPLPTTVFSDDDQMRLRLTLFTSEAYQNDESESDGLMVHFKPNANNAKDEFDADKLGNPDENLARYENGHFLSIEERSIPTADETLELFINGFTTDDYVLVADTSNWEDGQTAYLTDHYNNEQFLLSDGSNVVNFTVDTSIPGSMASDRFSIDLEVETFSVNDEELMNSFRIYPNPVKNGEISITATKLAGEEVVINLYNMIGQRIHSAENEFDESGNTTLSFNKPSAGVYFIAIDHQEKKLRKRIIIK